jgi:hypothetical protein
MLFIYFNRDPETRDIVYIGTSEDRKGRNPARGDGERFSWFRVMLTKHPREAFMLDPHRFP